MPVAPPIHHSVNVEILYQDDKGEVGSLLVPQSDLAFLTTIRDTSQDGKMKLTCRVTTHFGHQLKKAINNLGDIYQQQEDALGDEEAPEVRAALGTKKKRVKDLIATFDELFLTNPSPDLTGKNGAQLVPLYKGKMDLGMSRNLTNKAEFKKWEKYLVVVNLLDPEAETQTETEDIQETTSGE
jgi:hypothetical protein